MFLNRAQLYNDLFGLVGFLNPDNPTYPNISPSLLETRSSRYFNSVHPLLTIENIDQSIKNFSEFNYPAYSPTADANGDYSQGSKVSFNGVNYEYINIQISSGNPPPDASYWLVIDELSDYLIKTVYAGIDEMLDEWMDQKKIRTKVKSIYDKILLFNGNANRRNLIPNQNDFVGLRFRMKKGERSLVTIINKLGHHFNQTFNGLTVYLFHASQNEALATFTVNQTKALSSQWTTLTENNTLRYIDENYDAGGDFFLGYKQSQLQSLGAQALKMDLHWQKTPCSGCDSKWTEWYKQYSNFIDVIGFSVDENALGPGDTIFDPDDVSISYTNNYGLNINMSNKCDLGYFVAEEQSLFEQCLQLSVGKRLLQNIAYNTRGGNQIANQVKQEAKKELFHSSGVYGTVYDRWKASVKSLSFDLSGLNEECLPCDEGEDFFDNPIMGISTLR